jgi:hypothetical protein
MREILTRKRAQHRFMDEPNDVHSGGATLWTLAVWARVISTDSRVRDHTGYSACVEKICQGSA